MNLLVSLVQLVGAITIPLCAPVALRANEERFAESHPDQSCGQQCLALIAGRLGRDLPLKKIVSICPSGPQGASIAALSKCADTAGLHSLAIALPADRVKLIGTPAILHLQNDLGGHFVAVFPSRHKGDLHCWDPRTDSMEVISTLPRSFTGAALLISDSKVSIADFTQRADTLSLTLWSAAGILLLWRVLPLGICRGLELARPNRQPAAVLASLSCAIGVSGCTMEIGKEIESQGSGERIDLSQPVESSDIDFGEVIAGTAANRVGKIACDNNRTWVVKKIKTSCACTVAELDTGSELSQANEICFSISLRDATTPGRFESTIFVLLENDLGEAKASQFRVFGRIVRPITSVPSVVSLINKSHASAVLRFSSKFRGAKIAKVDCDHPYITARVAETSPDAAEIEASLDQMCPSGDIYGSITVHFSTPASPPHSIRVIGRKESPFRVMPRRLQVTKRIGSRTGQILRKLQVSREDGAQFSIRQAQKQPGVALVADESHASNKSMHNLVVVIDPSASVQQRHLVLACDDTNDACIIVPIVFEK
ncbi:Peptidase C39 family protein [Posidoniimonas corsicana]|uniref:Peptidase C39 family protein n=1 Tax=Posidoniimonas corsicana TaxID=1938618 RepID=A0A5C5VHE3_9BACT|nr:cysteine peptidase family C39 domain-containing protein [Posidoniimonas corsicana]TWT37155.1 Peptidase C39 family protein [Posidoniimonas corsicana]